MKRILLVNPWVCDFKFHDFWVRPYGLMRISTMLKKAGLEVSMIDCLNRHDPAMEKYGVKDRGFGRGDYHSEELEKPAAYRKVPRKYKRYGFPEEVLREKLESTKTPDLILLGSGITYTYEGLMKCHSILREYFPLTRLITGGIYATLCHEHAKKNLMPSAVWKGSINNEFVRAVNSMLGTNIGYMEAQEFSETVPDASFYPLSDFAAVRFTEGCPFSCSYCAAGSFYSSFYQRKKE
ncbi:MAG TPA: hypothetical protein P5511_10245, partial [Candidatus Goldiibacteriota bacterium]|nr:hypothetical protein [Candidatus Goldiibacteriota bacterium]